MSTGEGLILNHRGEEVSPKEPRIIALQIDDSGAHFHKINYKKDLVLSLQKTITFGDPGLMTLAEYFEDKEKTIRVLNVSRQYQIDPLSGKLIAKKTTRVYFNEDDSENEEIKQPESWYFYTPEESRNATHRRRTNITNKLEADMLNLLVQSAGGDPTATQASVQLGAAFIAELSPAINTFHLSGNTQAIVDFLNFEGTMAAYQFLSAPIAPGVTAKDFIIAGVTY